MHNGFDDQLTELERLLLAGAWTLSLSPADPADRGMVAVILADVAGTTPDDDGRLSVPVSDVAVVATIVNLLDDWDVPINELRLDRADRHDQGVPQVALTTWGTP